MKIRPGARRILIIEGHPDPSTDRFCHVLANAYAQGARAAGREVRRIAVGELDLPCLASRQAWEGETVSPLVRGCQQDVDWADHLVMIYPLWLGDVPAKLKAFLEQVFRPSFAFDLAKGPMAGRLKGRSARIVVTMGMPAALYRLWFGAHSVKSLQMNILGLCGIRPVRTSLVGMVESDKPGPRRAWLERLDRLGSAGR